MLGKIMTSIEGLTLNNQEIEILNNKNICGVILFSRNFENLQQLKILTKSIKDINPSFLIAVDHEGGRVWRFNQDFTKLPAMAKLGENYLKNKKQALSQAYSCGVVMASELINCNIDFSFAPVLDINYQNSSIIGNRSFSDNPQIIINLAEQLINGMKSAGMKCVAKHFPGHGFVKADSHLELPIDNREFTELKKDISVFEQLKNNIDAIMPAHIIYKKVDDKLAGFSKKWLDILKNDIGFVGLIISDDLSMNGAKVIKKIEDRITYAIEAGCDIVLICNDIEATKKAIKINYPLSNKPYLMQLEKINNYNYDKIKHLDNIKNI